MSVPLIAAARVPGRRRSVLAVVVAVIAIVGGLWSAGGVAAHAELLEITPADGALLDAAPTEVVLRWSEPVSITGGSARVLDDTAAVVSGEAVVVDGALVTIPITGELADGTYTVAWDVISEDSHPISGATVFYVGAPSTAGPVDAQAGAAGWGVRTGAAILTTLGYAGALVAAGAWWLVVIAGAWSAGLWRRIGTVAERAAVLGAVSLIAAVPLRIARLGGGLGALRDNALLAESLKGPLGISTLVTAVALLVLAGIAGRDDATPTSPATERSLSAADAVAVVAGVVALAGFAVEGHTRTQQPLALMVLFDLIHLAGGAVWLGGIAALVVAFRARTAPDALARVVVRFSRLAVFAVVAVVGAGIGMAVIVLPAPGDLVRTGWGLALLAKAALVVPVIIMGAYNRRLLVPATSDRLRTRLGRIVSAELLLLLAVVGVTSVLVTRSPVASSATPPAATAVPAEAVELPLSGDAGTVLFTVAPGRAGQNEIFLALRDPAGRPLEPADVPTVELTEPDLGVGPLRPIVHPLAVGEYHVIADLPLAGTYDMVVRVRVSDFEAATAETTLVIG